MDAQTRHNLKQNELGELIGDAAEYVTSRSFRMVLLIAALIGAAFLAYWSWSSSAKRTTEAAWEALYTSQRDAKDAAAAQAAIREIISRSSDPALLGAARMMLSDSIIDEGLEDDAKLTEKTAEARKLLDQLIADPALAPQLVAAARFKRASACETLGDFDAAKADYEAISKGERFAGTPWVSLAEGRLKDLDAIRNLKPLAPGSQPVASAPTNAVTLPISPTSPPGQPVEISPGVTIEKMDPALAPKTVDPLPEAPPGALPPAPASQPAASPAQP